MARLLDRYKKEIVPQLQKKCGRTNVMSLPRLQKIVVNMGVGKALQDKNRMEQSADQLTAICCQRRSRRPARRRVPPSGHRSAAASRRGRRMYSSPSAVSVALPRIPTSAPIQRALTAKLFDRPDRATVFPEINSEGVNFTHDGITFRHQHP